MIPATLGHLLVVIVSAVAVTYLKACDLISRQPAMFMALSVAAIVAVGVWL
jgi:hypothetical protein